MSDVSPLQSVTVPDPTSQMATLLGRLDQIAKNQILRLRIPRWDAPEIVVSYKPLNVLDYVKAMDGLGDLKGNQEIADGSLGSNLDFLIASCVSIEAKGGGIDHAWTGFGDSSLREALGIQFNSSRETCKKLFVAEGDVLAHARRLAEWSGFANRDVAEGFSGE